uniref:Glycosyltransferase n=1 Tax=Aegilops tauschii TaxID=37682 RepID=M8AX98_AEGTA
MGAQPRSPASTPTHPARVTTLYPLGFGGGGALRVVTLLEAPLGRLDVVGRLCNTILIRHHLRYSYQNGDSHCQASCLLILIQNGAAVPEQAVPINTAARAEEANSHRSPANQVPKPSKCRPGSHCCHRPILISSKHTEDAEQLTNGYLDTPVDDVPGLRSMRLRDFPSFIRTTDPDEYMVHYVLRETERTAGASAVILNSFGDLEGEAVEAMEALGLPKVYTLGPLPLLAHEEMPTPRSAINLSLWKEQNECLEWLDGKEPGSVVYVNFGSITVMTNAQMVEFAWGLAQSGKQFMWIVRRDLVKGDAAVLPEEFLAETAGRGLMASWCPQQQVLDHPAVGAFLTHSGWNSALESLCGGVPVISWPFFADQQTNCRYQCNEWGVGMEIDSNVRRDAVAGLIREIMEGEKGKSMRKRAKNWKESAVNAAMPGGSSHQNFDKLVRDVLLPKN